MRAHSRNPQSGTAPWEHEFSRQRVRSTLVGLAFGAAVVLGYSILLPLGLSPFEKISGAVSGAFANLVGDEYRQSIEKKQPLSHTVYDFFGGFFIGGVVSFTVLCCTDATFISGVIRLLVTALASGLGFLALKFARRKTFRSI